MNEVIVIGMDELVTPALIEAARKKGINIIAAAEAPKVPEMAVMEIEATYAEPYKPYYPEPIEQPWRSRGKTSKHDRRRMR